MLSPGADRQTRGSSLFQRPGKLKEASRRDFHSPSATDRHRHRHRHRHRQGTSSHCQESYLDLLILFANATIISTNVGSPSAPDQTCFCSTMLMPLSTMFSSQRDWRRKKLQQLCSFGRRENHRYRQYVTKYCVTFVKFIINIVMIVRLGFAPVSLTQPEYFWIWGRVQNFVDIIWMGRFSWF